MATNNKIGRLTARIDALISRRWKPLSMNDLTEDACAKLDRRAGRLRAEILSAGQQPQARMNCSRWSDDEILCALIRCGALNGADFKRPRVRS